MIKNLTGAGLLIMLAALAVPAQSPLNKKCGGRIFSAREVTRRARILQGPDLKAIKNNVELPARGTVVLNAVLCRNGQVTDIQVSEGLTPTINEFTVAALTLTRFVPAESRWHSVSQRMRFEFSFGGNEPGIRVTTSVDAAGRLVEGVNIVGHRRLTTEQVLSWIKTRPGEFYKHDQIERDFAAILATGHFDKTQTRVTLEDGIRGGVVVTFEVVELSIRPNQ